VPVSSLPLPKSWKKFSDRREAPGQHDLLCCDALGIQLPNEQSCLPRLTSWRVSYRIDLLAARVVMRAW